MTAPEPRQDSERGDALDEATLTPPEPDWERWEDQRKEVQFILTGEE